MPGEVAIVATAAAGWLLVAVLLGVALEPRRAEIGAALRRLD